MTVLEGLVEAGEIKKGIYWCKIKGKELSLRASKLQDILYDAIGRHTATAITNALPAVQFPRKCYVFSSSITSWKELRATINDSFVAILYKGKVWALRSKSGILEAFVDKNISDIEEMDIPTYMMKLTIQISWVCFMRL